MLFGLGDFHEIKLGAVGCIVPTLRKEREEWGTHFVFCAGSLKAGPPGWATRHRISWYRQHRTRPCKTRRSGAPTVSERESKKLEKAGHPALIPSFLPNFLD